MSDAEIDDLFSKVYAHCVIKYDPEAGKRVLREALAKPASEPAGGGVREAAAKAADFIRDNFALGAVDSRTNAGKIVDLLAAALSSPASSSPANRLEARGG